MRSDIQALRGFAVLLVVLYHAKVPALKAGYLGVDVFFVISGYLITRLVKNQIDEGAFSFVDFYSRRLRRLLPAAYATFVVTAIASALLLNGIELQDFGKQLLGAVTFSGNFVLWQQSGYFDGAASLKPLLHVWSLAIEEQYYLLLPVSLFIVPKRLWTVGAWMVFFSSLGLCLYFGPGSPAGTFYLIPTRAWELAIGSVGALTLAQYQWETYRLGNVLYGTSLCALLVLPLAPLGSVHPGLDALIVCTATLIVILARKESFASQLPGRILGWFGDISYSLYLVHWPLFALIHNVWFGPEPRRLRYLLVLVSIVWAYLQYRYIESPIRHSNIRLTFKTAGWVVATSLLIAAIPALELHRRGGSTDYTYMRRTNLGLGLPCSYRGDFFPQPKCQTSDKPSLLVWGDSFAMQLVPGILKHRGSLEVIQATRSACGPTLGLASFRRDSSGTRTRQFAESCTDFNQSVAKFLSSAPSVEIVVVSGAFAEYSWDANMLMEDKQLDSVPNVETALRYLKRTVETVRSLGKRIVLVAPVPGFGINIGSCNERKAAHRLIAGPHSQCDIPIAEHKAWQGLMLDFLARVPREAGVEVISFDGLLCDAKSCRTMLDNRSLYRDDWHLSYEGSELLAERSGLVQQILAKAR